MIKTTRYCDICGKKINESFNTFLQSPNFYQLPLPERDSNGEVALSEDKKDVCKECFKKLFWEISELKYPDGRFPF